MDYFNFLGKFILFIKIYNYNILLIELFDNQQPKITNATLRTRAKKSPRRFVIFPLLCHFRFESSEVTIS